MVEFRYSYVHVPLINHPKNEEGLFLDLIKKWEKYGSLYIGVDFDNTLVPYGSETCSETGHWNVLRVLKFCKSLGMKLCLWSLSTSQENLEWKVRWCKEHGIEMDYVNESPLMKEFDNVTGKPHFNVLIDDVSGLEEIYSVLFNLCLYIEKKKIYEENLDRD